MIKRCGIGSNSLHFIASCTISHLDLFDEKAFYWACDRYKSNTWCDKDFLNMESGMLCGTAAATRKKHIFWKLLHKRSWIPARLYILISPLMAPQQLCWSSKEYKVFHKGTLTAGVEGGEEYISHLGSCVSNGSFSFKTNPRIKRHWLSAAW